jgi:hypothetical protein
MGTSYKVQIDNEKGKYEIQFETTNYDYYKMVERACQKAIDKAIDKKNKAVLKERCSQMRVFGHL